MEHLKYAGLRIEDKAALLDAKAKGAEWVARDSDSTGMICGFHNKPRRFTDGEWITNDGFVIGFRQTLRFVKAKSADPVNIDAALLQIAEMERAVEEGRQVMESLEKDSVTVIKDAYSLAKPPCPYCSTDAFERVGIVNDEFDTRPRVYLCGGNNRPSPKEHFIFCPMCARRLIKEEK